MPLDQRCRWTDVSPLLDGELARRYHSLGCADREALAARLWWLAHPLLSLPGNDRRTEHFARITMTRLMQDARTAYGIAWSWDLDELTLRYGWPAWWAREETRPGQLGAETGVIGHEPSSPTTAAPSWRGEGSGARYGSVMACPSCVNDAPMASCAAAGAKTSRAWNVAAAPGGIGSDTKWASAGRHDSRPLSGATKKWPPAPAARARRLVPTPGSTTARCTVPCGKRCHTRDRMYCPARRSPGGTSCVMSSSAAPCTRDRSTPFTSPT